MSDLNGRSPGDLVAGDQPLDLGEIEPQMGGPVIHVRGEFIGGDPDRTRVRDVSVTFPVKPGDTWTDYASVIETAVREIGNLGYLPGYEAPKISIGNA